MTLKLSKFFGKNIFSENCLIQSQDLIKVECQILTQMYSTLLSLILTNILLVEYFSKNCKNAGKNKNDRRFLNDHLF